MIELNPLIILEGQLLREEKDYRITKNSDKSISIFLKKQQLDLKFVPSILEGGIPAFYAMGNRVNFNDYAIRSFHHEGKPGVEIGFRTLPIKQLILIPRVMEEKEYTNQVRKEQKRAYEKERGFMWK